MEGDTRRYTRPHQAGPGTGVTLSIEDHVLQSERCNFVNDQPYRQSKRSYVFFVRRGQQDLAVKAPHSRFRAEKEVMRLKRLGHLGITTVAVPRLVSVGRIPRSYIMMTRLFGQTLAEKWETAGKPSDQERDRVGAVLGRFLAELHRKTGRVHGDLTHNNIMVDAHGHVAVVDWGSSLRPAPHAAFFRLMMEPVNLAPAAARVFSHETGITINPYVVATRAVEDDSRLARRIGIHLTEWVRSTQQPALLRP